MLVLASLSLNLYILFRLRRHFVLERMSWMLAGCIAGVPLGVWLLVRADEALLRRILGIVLLLTVAQRFVPLVKGKRWHPVWVGAPCGLFSGALSGAFATGGPPVVAYVQSQHFDRFRYVASVQLALALSAVVRVGCLGTARLLTWQLMALSALGAVCAVAGSWFGLHILKRLPERALRAVIAVMLLALAGKYLGFY